LATSRFALAERCAVKTDSIPNRFKLMWRLARLAATRAANVDTEFRDDGVRSCSNVPTTLVAISEECTHSHHRTERLKPEGMRQPG
jgi:hypothetical protein